MRKLFQTLRGVLSELPAAPGVDAVDEADMEVIAEIKRGAYVRVSPQVRYCGHHTN